MALAVLLSAIARGYGPCEIAGYALRAHGVTTIVAVNATRARTPIDAAMARLKARLGVRGDCYLLLAGLDHIECLAEGTETLDNFYREALEAGADLLGAPGVPLDKFGTCVTRKCAFSVIADFLSQNCPREISEVGEGSVLCVEAAARLTVYFDRQVPEDFAAGLAELLAEPDAQVFVVFPRSCDAPRAAGRAFLVDYAPISRYDAKHLAFRYLGMHVMVRHRQAAPRDVARFEALSQ
jgi:hypothetical protein